MDYQAYVGGDLSGQVVVGDNNLLVNATAGSVVKVNSGDPPPVRRRQSIEAKAPRPGPDPLGRHAEIGEVGRSLDDGIPVQVYGGPGRGKTTVLRHVAHQRSAASDVIFLSAAGLAVDDVLQDLFDACYETSGYRPEPPRLRRLMGSVRALLVVDDFEGTSEDVDVLLDAVPACDVIVGSRCRTVWSAGRAIELVGVPDDAGVMLLARELGRDLTPEEHDDAVRLCSISEGNPAALVQIAAAVRAGGGQLQEYEDSGRVAAVLAEHLDAPARVVLGVLAALVGVASSVVALQALAGTDGAEVTNRLERAGLITARGDGYQLAGPLAERVAQMAGEQASPAEMAEALSTWLATAPIRRDVTKAAPAIVQVLRAAVEAGAHPEAIALARSASPRLALALRLGAWGDLLELGRTAARAAGDTAAEAYFTHEAGARLASLGKGVAAGVLLGSAAELWRRIGDHESADASQAQADALAPQPASPTIQQSASSPSGGSARSLSRVVGNPAVIGLITTCLVAGGIAYANSGSNIPALTIPLVPTSSVPSTPDRTDPSEVVTEPPPTRSVTESSQAGSVPPSQRGGGDPAQEEQEYLGSGSSRSFDNGPIGCLTEGSYDWFIASMDNQTSTATIEFLSDPCHPNGLDTSRMALRKNPEGAFDFTPISCPSPLPSNGNTVCSLSITFTYDPQHSGGFTGEIYIPEVSQSRGDLGHVITLSGW